MAEAEPPREGERRATASPQRPSGGEVLVQLRWPLAFLAALILVLVAGFLVYRETVRNAGQVAAGVKELAGSAAREAERIAARFQTGTITETFIAAIPEIDPSAGGNLELAVARVTETFKRSDERRILWDAVSLGTTVTEIQVPVTYRYHVRLSDPWRLEIEGQTCIVHAPALRPSLPPAIHTDRMVKRVDADLLRYDAADQLDALERSITPRLIAYARDKRHLDLVREASRKEVAEFVRTWLLREEQWQDDRFRAVKVIFPDEEKIDPERIGASVVLEDDGA